MSDPRDPDHIERRLLVLAELLDNAVAEVRRVAAEIVNTRPPGPDTTDGDTNAP